MHPTELACDVLTTNSHLLGCEITFICRTCHCEQFEKLHALIPGSTMLTFRIAKSDFTFSLDVFVKNALEFCFLRCLL